MTIEHMPPGADIFAANVDAMACPVNCVGVMGAGLAAAFRSRFPAVYEPYKQACRDEKIVVGRVFTISVSSTLDIVCVPTKMHWKRNSELGNVQRAIDDLGREADRRQWRRLAVPALGCGLGGLDFEPVKAALESTFLLRDAHALIFPPRMRS